QDMLSAQLSGREIARLRRDVGASDPLYPALTKAARAFKAGEDEEPEARTLPRDDLAAAADDLYQALYDGVPRSHPHARRLTRLMLDCMWYARRHGEFDEAQSRLLTAPEGKFLEATLLCVDPSAHLETCLSRVGGTVFFSATLTPAAFYADALRVREENGDALLSLASPFPPENQLTLLMETPTRFRERENTLNEVVRAIHEMARAKPGNYIACFPSHAYLAMAYERFLTAFSDVRAIRQSPRMDEAARAAFIEAFQPAPETSMVAFIAMGGVFAEGIDLPGERLIGAAIVTVAIPQICREREVLREMHDDGEDGGYDCAYVFPGFRRVLQAAGRVIRTETDRGVVLLIDERFAQEKYIALMPANWRVNKVDGAEGVRRAVARFWRGG
ncbi:MAG: ATP-dependent DNA helicase, partial [Christensenellales bacterium]